MKQKVVNSGSYHLYVVDLVGGYVECYFSLFCPNTVNVREKEVVTIRISILERCIGFKSSVEVLDLCVCAPPATTNLIFILRSFDELYRIIIISY